MAGQKFTLTFDANLNVSQMKGALANVQRELGKLQLPSNISQNFTKVINNLSKEISNFEVLTSKDLTDPKQFKQIEASADKILNLYKLIQVQIKDLGNTASIDIKKLFPESAIKSIDKGKDAIAAYEKEVEKLDNKVKAANDNLKNWQDKLQVRTSKKNEKYNEALNDLTKDLVSDLAKKNGVKQQINDYNDLIIKIEKADKALKEYDEAVKKGPDNGGRKPNWLTEAGLFKNLERLKNTEKAYQEELKNNPNIIIKAEKAVSTYSGKVTEAENKIAEFTATLKRLEDEAVSGKVNALDNLFKELEDNGFDTSGFERSVEGAKKAIEDFERATGEGIRTTTDQAREGIDNQSEAFEDNAHAAENAAEANKDFMNQMNEVDQIKSRIQYFFGLTNTINLFKQAVRGAYETIKELDKAMTETAVVTDFSVGDMWKQLPEYTKRANELGVTTKAAYEAATLYYQQGLTTQEVNALSVETLKMARIAGLDAAEATDRMTNALRGFNMELNEVNAQRIDDVYSKLAAITASNVDEISTAMTKVASLAHNANMEFETTAAFLAQIIETTRESAETAGTALKTVVARFSEVKELYDKGQLEGSDEEGEGINVNKVSSALRTAGIDLNRYFLGEIGLDDIFLQLAEKWDSLTAIQQRYIATQAAGSRQQSRFIALMSDYARTQELVSAAYEADGAAAQQFEKTQESLESKLARLKNAWDEFLMGLTNNSIVKAGVDLLTTLLNTVNSLTSAFGEGAGSIAKWILAIGSLRGMASLFKRGGLLDKALSGSIFGSILGSGTTNSNIAGLGLGIGKTLKTGLSNLGAFTMAGAAQSGGAGILGKLFGGAAGWDAAGLGASASTATMIAGISAALLGVAAAAGAAYGAYKLWLNYTPEGQLKSAKKLAEELQKDAKEAQNTADSLKNLQDSYNNYTAEIENASSITERKDAIKARNDAILKAIDENPNYSQYLRTDFDVDGELILTLDEGQVTQAAIDAAKDATKAAIDSYFGQADIALKQAQVYAQQQQDQIYSLPSYAGVQLAPITIEGDKTGRSKILQEGQLAAAKSYANLAYSSMIEALDTNFTPEVSKGLANAFSEIYVSLAQEGKEIQQGAFEGVISELSKGNFTDLFKIFSTESINDKSLFGVETKDLTSVLNVFGTTEDEIKTIATLLGIEEKKIQDLITARAAEIKEIQKSNRSKVFDVILQSGAKVNKGVQEFINSLSPEKVQEALDLLMSSSSVLTPEQQKSFIENDLQNIFQAKDSQAQIDNLNYLFNSINLDNPIKSFKVLNSLIEDGPTYAKEYAKQIKEANKASFSKGNMFQSFLSSKEYGDIAESISKIYKENGRISSKNLAELTSESAELKAFIDDDVLSVRELSEALEAINSGAPMEGLTDNVIDVFNEVVDLDDLLWDLHDTIQNFDTGLDYGEGTDFIVNLTDQLLEMTENYEFGNQQYKNIYTQLFGPEAYNEFMSKYGTMGIEDFTAMAKAQIERLKDWADEESYGFMMASAQGLNGIQGISGGPDNFTWDVGTKTIDQLRDYVSETLGVSLDTAMGLIEGAMAHMPDLRVELKTNEYKAAIDELVKSTENGAKITQAQLEVIATKYGVEIGKNIDQIKADIQEVAITGSKQFNFPVTINWVDENTHQLLTKESLTQKFDKEFDLHEVIEGAWNDDQHTLNIDALFSNLSELGLTDDQAKTVAEHIREQLQEELKNELNGNPIKFSKDVTITEFDTSGDQISVKNTPQTLTSESLDDLDDQVTAKVQEGLQDANYKIVADSLAEYDFEEVRQSLQEALDAASRTAQKTLSEEWAKLSFKMTGNKLADDLYEGFVNGMQRAQEYAYQNPIITPVQQQSGQQAASGGIVKSLAGGSGNQFLQPGWALTGEEAPEIVWNKEQGYAYITGANGPEFRMLQPGDRVFNAQETSRILKNSKGAYIDSFARGSWNSSAIRERRAKKDKNSGGSGGSGSSGAKEPTKEEWRSDFDWLYNLMEDITELQREQNKLQEEQNKILELGNDSDTGKDLYENLIKQMANLLTQKTYQSTVQANRHREMQEFMAANAGYGEYFRFNSQDKTLEINWDAINEIGDKETYEKVKDLVSEAEAIQKKMDDSEDAVRDIETQIRQLENIWRDSYVSFEKRVLDALVKSYQRVIDNYSDLNDTVTRTNNDILNAIQKEISLERQIRDNTETEDSIFDAEARLAFLRRDTTGGNQVEILNAQKQLDQERRQYEDTLIDQAIARLQDDNEVAAEQRDEQIELMQAQLDYAAETGAFNDQVYALISGALGADGELLTNSDLFELLQQEESWAAMSDTSKQVWEDELNNTFKEVSAYLLKQQGETDGSYLQAVASEINDGVWASAQVTGDSLQVGLGNIGDALAVGLDSISWNIGSLSQAMDHIAYSFSDAVSALSDANAQLADAAAAAAAAAQQQYYESQTLPEPESEPKNWEGFSEQGSRKADTSAYWERQHDLEMEEKKRKKERLKKAHLDARPFATGGLTTKTGLAWLDGTPSEPEYVLNARQTDAFLKLAEVLPSMLNGTSTTTNTIGGNMYLEFHVNVDNISDDYDLDQLVERVKEDIYSAASYRNANIINFSR